MKKYILLFIVLLTVAMSGCTKEPVNNNGNDIETPGLTLSQEGEQSLSELQEKIRAEGKLLGVAYLGFVDYDIKLDLDVFKNLEHIQELPFVENIPECSENEGYRVYAIVPADEQVKITVSKCEFDDDYMPFAGEKMVEANGPVLVRGNVSDTVPNLYVVAKKGDLTVEYTPVQSGMDGKLDNSENKVYDFTPYDKMAEFSLADELPDAVFCGSWIAFENIADEERVLILDIEADGDVKYAYGIGNSEILEQFEGTWELEGDLLRFFMIGGPPESIDNPIVHEPYECNPTFAWEVNADGLLLTHIYGDEILFGTKGNTFEFHENEY